MEAFSNVDKLVSKPVLGSDGAARWQDFANKEASSTNHKAPLFKDSQRLETEQVSKGYEHFKQKTVSKSKEQKRIEKRIRPEKADYFIASNTFQGPKFDYIFTTRDRGTGYYWDGMDSLKTLRGETVYAKQESGKGKEVEQQPVVSEPTSPEPQPQKKKRKQGPTIVETPNHPLEQIQKILKIDLPPGWASAKDPISGKTYYYRGQNRQWQKPSFWHEAKDATGRTYYYHVVTRETKWDKPEE